jgi:hypothetical protein
MAFELFGGPESLPFLDKLNKALVGLPIIGDAAHEKVIALAHYSRDGGVVTFENQYQFSWTNKVAARPAIIGDLTGLHGRKFRSICLIKLGIGPTYKPRTYGAGLVDEYAIDMQVHPGQFTQLPLVFDEETGLYI